MARTYDRSDLEALDAASLRQHIRAGRFDGVTSGLARRRLQGNLVIVPQRLADAFEAFCAANPRSLPLIERGRRGGRMLDCGADLDIATDVPRYRVWRDGRPAETRSEIIDLWEEDSVAFVLGCWFANEAALLDAGVRLRHLELGVQGALFRTARPATPAHGLAGPIVMSMRPFADGDVQKVIDITGRNALAHGAPAHVGDPGDIGVADLETPDWGAPLLLEAGESAIFWECGLTGQEALTRARPPLFITHEPGCMVLTDLPAGMERSA